MTLFIGFNPRAVELVGAIPHFPNPLEPFAVLGHHYIYPYAWVCIVQPDETYEIARMD
jgi:hypothetical protein